VLLYETVPPRGPVAVPLPEQVPPEQDRDPENVVVPRGPVIDPLREPASASATTATDKAPAIAKIARIFFMVLLSCGTVGARGKPNRVENLPTLRQRNFNGARR